jgi:hypothetical protein
MIAAAGRGMGRNAAHELYHLMTASLRVSQRHPEDPSDIMWGTNPGGAEQMYPAQMYFGFQEFKPDRKSVLRQVINSE